MANYSDKKQQETLFLLLSAAVRVIGSVVSRNTEVVLHDLRKPEFSIVEIINPEVTGRKQGDSVLAGLRTDRAFISAMEIRTEPVTLLLDYPTFSREGKPLRSSTAIYRDTQGKPFAALCINVNNAEIVNALNALQALTSLAAVPAAYSDEAAQTAPQLDNIEDLMQEIISTTIATTPANNRAEIKRINLLAVQHMQERGIFLMKGGVEKAASALGVTRYTIYNYLDELKNENR